VVREVSLHQTKRVGGITKFICGTIPNTLTLTHHDLEMEQQQQQQQQQQEPQPQPQPQPSTTSTPAPTPAMEVGALAITIRGLAELLEDNPWHFHLGACRGETTVGEWTQRIIYEIFEVRARSALTASPLLQPLQWMVQDFFNDCAPSHRAAIVRALGWGDDIERQLGERMRRNALDEADATYPLFNYDAAAEPMLRVVIAMGDHRTAVRTQERMAEIQRRNRERSVAEQTIRLAQQLAELLDVPQANRRVKRRLADVAIEVERRRAVAPAAIVPSTLRDEATTRARLARGMMAFLPLPDTLNGNGWTVTQDN
jgi:hypothetical protein